MLVFLCCAGCRSPKIIELIELLKEQEVELKRKMKEAREQTLLTVVSHLLHGGDYRALFTTRDTFLTRRLAALYGVPVSVSDIRLTASLLERATS